ncbi:MAG: hypothetical protein Q8891_12340 [Bacteroidota bacterium]|nr:hypothetical protein [Bacteroidota bacterium]
MDIIMCTLLLWFPSLLIFPVTRLMQAISKNYMAMHYGNPLPVDRNAFQHTHLQLINRYNTDSITAGYPLLKQRMCLLVSCTKKQIKY